MCSFWPTYHATSEPSVLAKVCDGSTAVVVGIWVVEVVGYAVGESKETGQLHLKALLLVSCGTSRTALCLHNEINHLCATTT